MLKFEELPAEIKYEMLINQKKQGNIMNEEIFRSDIKACKKHGGFDWDVTEQGYGFWSKIICSGNIDTFYEKKDVSNDCKNNQTFNIIVEVDYDINFLNNKLVADAKYWFESINTGDFRLELILGQLEKTNLEGTPHRMHKESYTKVDDGWYMPERYVSEITESVKDSIEDIDAQINKDVEAFRKLISENLKKLNDLPEMKMDTIDLEV